MPIILIEPPLEGSPLENPLPTPDVEVPGEVENPGEFPYAVPEGEIMSSEYAEVSHTTAFGSEISPSDAPLISEWQSDPTVEERLEVIRVIVEDGQIDRFEATILHLLSLDLSPSDLFVLLERFDAAVADGTIAFNLEIADNFWEHQDFNNCVVVVQKMILDALGIPNSEAQLTLRALLDGSLPSLSDGIDPLRVGEILERHGVGVHHIPYATEADLEAKLVAGHGVMVGVDAHELWEGDNDALDGGRGDNHVVWLLEIDRSDPDNPVAVMNDSGVEDGAERRVPLHIFMDAFADSEGFAVVTDEPLEQLRQRQEAEDAAA